jgi:hypothetical protein
MIWGHPLEGTFFCVSSPTLHAFRNSQTPNLGFLACEKSTLKHKEFSPVSLIRERYRSSLGGSVHG